MQLAVGRHPCWRGLLLAALVLPLRPSLAGAQTGYCDLGLPVSSDNPLRYHERGSPKEHTDRCEGLYIQEVRGTALLVASFTRSFGEYDLTSAEPLRIEWQEVATPVRLRAYGLRQRLYYRMDTERPPGPGRFTWPTGVLAALNVGPGDVGVIGWTERSVGPAKRNVYLPLTIRQRQAPTTANGYRVVLVPGQELEEVYVSLAAVDAKGMLGAYLRDGAALDFGYYPAGKPIVVPVAGLRQPGLYYLELAATLRGGGSAGVDLWFQHTGD